MKAATGAELRELGMQLAMDFAGDDWKESALNQFRDFCLQLKASGRTSLRIEEFRAVAPQPRSPNAWGPFPFAAAKRGMIEATNELEKAQSAKTHSHRVMRWRIVL